MGATTSNNIDRLRTSFSNLKTASLSNLRRASFLGSSDSLHSLAPPVKKKNPWYKNKATRVAVLVAIAVIAFVAIYVASLEIRLEAPVILMTSHDYANIVAFNANTGAFITTELLDLSYPQKKLDFPTYVSKNKIQFRSIITRNYNQITVANGRHATPFIATFDCDTVPGWKLNTYFANNSKLLAHPYGLTWYEPRKWWLFTTQDTSSLFIFDEHGQPVVLPGMMQHFPGAVFTLINTTNGFLMDTYIPNSIPFNQETRKQQHADMKKKPATMGIRGVAVDAEFNLIFVAAEILGKVLVFDMDNNFSNPYNITFGSHVAPISVLNGAPYHPRTLFVTERKNADGVYAFRYDKSGYSTWWKAEKVPGLQHATGIALAPDSLFVLSQSTHSILRYSPYSGRYLGIVVHFLNDDPSGIITHKGIGRVGNPVENVRTLGEQLLYIPSGKKCTVT